jgi:hypothetical protein
MNNLFVNVNRNYYLFKTEQYNEYLEIALYALVLLFVPLFHSHQLIVGTIVNALLIKAALNHSMKKMFVLAFLPSLSVISTGFLFGSLTPLILLMVPFIWISNLLIIFVTKKLFVAKTKNYFKSTLIASIGKALFLFCGVIIMFFLGLVPVALISVFSFMQLITAESGAIIVGISKLKKRKNHFGLN